MSAIAPAPVSDREQRAKMLTALAEVFGEDIGVTRLAAYIQALSDVPLDSLRLGLQHAVKAQTFFPKPAELRRAVDHALNAQAVLARARAQIVEDTDWRLARFCTVCEDSGMAYVKRGTHDIVPHAQVHGSQADWQMQPCVCRDHNPAIRRRCGAPKYGAD